MKEKSRLSAHRKPVGKNLKPISESQIDFSDIPVLSDAQLASMRRISSVSEGLSKSRYQAVTKKLQQLKLRSGTLTGIEIVAVVQSDRKRTGRC